MLGKRKYVGNKGGFTNARVTSTGLVLKYNKAPARYASSRYNRRFGTRYGGGNPFGLQRAMSMSKELGFVDLASAGYAEDTTGSVTLLNLVAQGTAVTQRVGKKIRMKGLQIRGYNANGSTSIFNDTAWLIVYDKRPTGALPAVTDILVTANSQAMNNDANAGRFAILKRQDRVLLGNGSVTGAVANALTDSFAISEDCYLDLGKREVVYKAAGTGAIGDIEQGALYLVTVGSTAAGTAAAALQVTFRMRFWDT